LNNRGNTEEPNGTDAEAEFDTAVEYCEQFQEGLGFEFAEEICSTISRIILSLFLNYFP
jgi:hypothetical protein